ncbi:MAG: acetyl-CoA carboxylase, carboxyltransferase subunit beta [Bacillota bacterium]|nr:acetyl-CoA carboxylase, carboxyltransferase subunit beta [Bacillota bacterium]
MIHGLFKKTKYVTSDLSKTSGARPSVPDGMWVKCSSCGEALYGKDVEKHLKICPHCGAHFRLTANERISLICDKFEEINSDFVGEDPLSFPGYKDKLKKLREETSINEAVVTGIACINGQICMLGVMDSSFLMGSMGSAVGEKLTCLIEQATINKKPVVIFTASGGARMQEGIISLMQMAKVSAALARHHEAGLFYLTVLTDPTTGGVTASFAMLGDIILAEPGALIGFAGPRVIADTIRQKLPDGFQRAEFLLEHGFVDAVVSRDKLKDAISQLLAIHAFPFENNRGESLIGE